jgi:hypothetical protein
MKTFRWLILGILMAAMGCQGVDPNQFGLPAIWNEAKEIPVGQVLWLWVRDVVLGGALGVALGLLLFLTLKKYRCYRVVGAARVWVLIGIGLVMTVGGAVLGFGLGNLQAGADIAVLGVRETNIGKKALPAVGEMAADIVALAEQMLLQEKAIDEVGVEAFQKGAAAVNVAGLIEHLNDLQKGAAQKLADRALDRALDQNPEWRGGATEKVARWALPLVARYLVDERMRREMANYGIPDFLDDLAAEARQKPGGTMTRAEIGRFFAERVLGPALTKPICGAVWKTQLMLVLAGVAGTLLPIGLIELSRRLNRKPTPTASESSGRPAMEDGSATRP